jgi:N6-L-threonylcarbamoyladenine synthase
MKILGIESSCDESACSIVEDGKKVLSNTIASQIDIHAKTGGVVPEVAAREHVLKLIPVLDECLEEAHCGWDNIDAVAITKGPGLISSLIIGTETASVISYVKNKILIPVQHIVGHIYSNWLDNEEGVEFPVLILTVSGGHNELILMRGHHDFKLLGETRDDAAGEAFDKVARILDMGYPGGPAISKAALNANPKAFSLPRSYLEKGCLDFSFSGLKTAVLNEFKEYILTNQIVDSISVPENFKNDLAASFQEAVVEVLAKKLMMAAEKYPEIKEIHLAGGVSANSRLREFIQEIKPSAVKFRHPQSIKYCTDNAAMIASAAYFLYENSPNDFEAMTNVVPSSSFSLF